MVLLLAYVSNMDEVNTKGLYWLVGRLTPLVKNEISPPQLDGPDVGMFKQQYNISHDLTGGL